jgi:hypothetical protein
MRTQSAAPRLAPGRAASSTACTGSGKSGERTLTQLDLPAHVLHLLHEEGVRSLSDWRQLRRKRRYSIFGLTTAAAKKLDAAAREAT